MTGVSRMQPMAIDVELLQQKLEFAEFEWNRATDGMKERDATIATLKARAEELERVIEQVAEYLQKAAERRTLMLSQTSWIPKRSTVEADRNACVTAGTVLRAAIWSTKP